MKFNRLKAKDKILFEDLLWCAEKINDMPQLHNRTILITGATGLIGSLMAKAILVANYKFSTNIKIVALVRNLEKAKKVFDAFDPEDSIQFCCADLCGDIKLENEIDFLVHTASVTASREFVTRPVETIDLTYLGTKNILELCRQKKVKSAVYLSSMEVYGKTDAEKENIIEKDLGYIDILNVRSSYSEGKRIAECLCAAYHGEYGVPVKIGRLAQTFGAGIGTAENRVFAQFAKSVMHNEDIILHTKGESYGNYCYTRECIWGVLLILLKGKEGEAYTVTNDRLCVQIKEMASMVVDKFSNGTSKVIYDIPDDAMQYGYAPDVKMHLSADKLKKLGWNAEISLEDAYSRMIESLKAQTET